MDQELRDIISSIQESHFSESEKKLLLTSLKKNGLTQEFADIFAESLSKRGAAINTITKNFDTQFTELLQRFEKEGVILEQEHLEYVSALDPSDTAGERILLDAYAIALKKQRNDYEKKVRDLTIELAKATEKIS